MERPSHLADLGGQESSPKSRSTRVAVVGTGRIGSTFARSLVAGGWDVRLVMGSSPLSSSAQGLASEIGCAVARSAGEVIYGSDLVLLCVPDTALRGVVGELSAAAGAVPGPDGRGKLVGHTTGSVGISVLEPLASSSWGTFALHPVVSIVDRGSGPEALRDRYAAITASVGASEAVFEMARALSMRPFAVAEEDRAAYHLACVVASNFLVTLAAAADRIASAAGVREAPRVLLSLMQSTLDNLEGRSPEEALTGPIARGDTSTVEAHLEVLESRDPRVFGPYIGLSEATLEIARLPEVRRAELEALLSRWKRRVEEGLTSGKPMTGATQAWR